MSTLASFPVPFTPGPALSLAGTNIKTTYTQGAAMQAGRASRVRFWLHVITAVGSALTTISVKLQQRYNDGATALGWIDLPSYLDDVQGAAQPKGSTLELVHAFTVAANATYDFSFYLDKPQAQLDLVVAASANAAGIAGDSLVVYAQAE